MPEQTPQFRLAQELWQAGPIISLDDADVLADYVFNHSDVIREMRRQDRCEAWAAGRMSTLPLGASRRNGTNPYEEARSLAKGDLAAIAEARDE